MPEAIALAERLEEELALLLPADCINRKNAVKTHRQCQATVGRKKSRNICPTLCINVKDMGNEY
jgi:hypothetical protein